MISCDVAHRCVQTLSRSLFFLQFIFPHFSYIFFWLQMVFWVGSFRWLTSKLKYLLTNRSLAVFFDFLFAICVPIFWTDFNVRKDTLNKNFVKKCVDSGAFPKRSSGKKIKRSAESFNFGVTWGVVQKSKTFNFRQNAFSVACRGLGPD